MTRGTDKIFADRLIEWIGALLFAGACSYAAFVVGGGRYAAIAGAAAFMAGLSLLAAVGNDGADAGPRFEPVAFESDDANDEELLLDDPLAEAPSAQVVRLFSADTPTPGALVARIEDYLARDLANRPVQTLREAQEVAAPVDASAALHAALANIRASLR